MYCTVLPEFQSQNQTNNQALSALKPLSTQYPVAPSTAMPTASASLTPSPVNPVTLNSIDACLLERGRLIDAINSHPSEPATTAAPERSGNMFLHTNRATRFLRKCKEVCSSSL